MKRLIPILSKALLWLLLALVALAALMGMAACTSSPSAAPPQSQQQANPVGVRTSTTPTTTLATYAASGRHWTLVSYRDPIGEHCIAIDQGTQQGIPVCAIPVDSQHPMNAAFESEPNNVIVMYGRADETVQHIYAISKSDRKSDQTIYRDPSSRERYFAVFIVGKSVTDVDAVTTGGKRFSFKPQLDQFYSPA